MLNKQRYLVYSYDEDLNLFRVHKIGSLYSCSYLINQQIKVFKCDKIADIFKIMNVSDFVRFSVSLNAKVEYPLGMEKANFDELKLDSANPLYALGFTGSDRFGYGS